MLSESRPVLGLAIATVFIVSVYRYIVYPAVLSPLARIPNAHWSAPLTRLWILYVRYVGRENRTLLEAHRRLGPVVRVGPSELSINDIDAVRAVYQGGFEKTDWYSVFDNYGVPCLFSELSSREHSARKRLISNVYSKSYIQSSASFSAQARVIVFDRLVPLLRDSTSETQRPHGIDIYSVFMAVTMDFIAAYVFGLGNGTNFLAGKKYRDHFFELYKFRKQYGFYEQELPRLAAFCEKIGIPLYSTSVYAANNELHEWCERLCEKTSTDTSEGQSARTTAADEPVVWNALVSGLEKERDAKGTSSFLYRTVLSQPKASIASEIFDHIIAGQETASLALTYLSWRLSQSLELQAELRAELLTLQPNLRLQENETSSLPDPKKLDGLPLLHAVITETLRLHPPNAGPQPRQTPEPSCQIGPYRVPGGVRIAALTYTLHRDERVFPEPNKWDHTRWLTSQASEEEMRERNRLFWAFGSGGRMCIGSNFAMQEMKLITAAIYSNFTTHIVDDEGMAEPSDSYTSRPGKDWFYIRLEPVE